jgi:hypothetical protein
MINIIMSIVFVQAASHCSRANDILEGISMEIFLLPSGAIDRNLFVIQGFTVRSLKYRICGVFNANMAAKRREGSDSHRKQQKRSISIGCRDWRIFRVAAALFLHIQC